MPQTTRPAEPHTASVQILRIELKTIIPTIWRQVAVPDSISLDTLHRVIQTSMGWSDTHPHRFEIAGRHYRAPVSGSHQDGSPVAEQGNALVHVLQQHSTFHYVYDFGDNWEHLITLEKTLPAEACPALPYCIDGANACPPEDIGGAPGYGECLAALTDPTHPEHGNMLEWFGEGGFDPAAFDAVRVNRLLRQIGA
ncbi:plasmid pRiA4b ORF-3 family protein [Pseudomonas gingeri]